MRLLVTADLHLGSPIRSVALRNAELGERLQNASRAAFVRIVDLAVASQVDALVLAGDIFDNDVPDLKARAFLITQLLRAADAGVPTVLIRGNHDALLDHRAHGALGENIYLLHRENPTVEIGGAAFHGLSFEEAHSKTSFLPDYPQPVPGLRNIGVMHTSLDGSPGHDPYAPCSSADLMRHGYDLWCLGHIHAPFERREGDVLAVMPGIPQPRHFGERTGGAVALITLGEGAPEMEQRSVAGLRFAAAEIDLIDGPDLPETTRRLRDALVNAQVDGMDTALRLQAVSERHSTEWLTELAGELVDDMEGVFLDKVKSRPVPPTAGAASESDDLLRFMRDELQQPGLRHAAAGQLDELRQVLPSEIADELAEGELDDLLAEAVDEIARALHGERSS